MQTLMFNFRPNIHQSKQDKILNQITSWKNVITAHHLKSDTANEVIARMCYVQIGTPWLRDLKNVARRLSRIGEIEEVHIPAHRSLLNSMKAQKKAKDRKKEQEQAALAYSAKGKAFGW